MRGGEGGDCHKAAFESAKKSCKLDSTAAVGRPHPCWNKEVRLGDAHSNRRKAGG